MIRLYIYQWYFSVRVSKDYTKQNYEWYLFSYLYLRTLSNTCQDFSVFVYCFDISKKSGCLTPAYDKQQMILRGHCGKCIAEKEIHIFAFVTKINHSNFKCPYCYFDARLPELQVKERCKKYSGFFSNFFFFFN